MELKELLVVVTGSFKRWLNVEIWLVWDDSNSGSMTMAWFLSDVAMIY